MAKHFNVKCIETSPGEPGKRRRVQSKRKELSYSDINHHVDELLVEVAVQLRRSRMATITDTRRSSLQVSGRSSS